MDFGLTATLVLLAAAVTVSAIAIVMDRRPYVPGRLWAVPYKMVLFIGVLAVVVLAAHLVSILTGAPLRGRLNP